jgi:aminocarboxymuconate-semialdehyde decarboxylase
VAAEVIDVHAHVVFETLNNTAGNYGPEAGVDQTGVPFFRIGGYIMKPISYQGTVFTDLDLRISHLDRLGIDIQVLSPNPLTFFHGIESTIATDFCLGHNQLMKDTVAAAPDRLVGLAALPMQEVSAACEELERAVGTFGLKGAMIGTDIPQGFACQSLDPFYQKLTDLDVPLFIHASSTDGVSGLKDDRLGLHNFSLSLGYAQEETLAVAQLLLGGVLDRHPALDICISHGGGTAAFLAEKIDQLAQVDPAASEGVRQNGFGHELQKLWFDTHVKGEVAAKALRHYAHADKLVLGTNLGGFDTPEALSADAERLSQNAKRLLRLP